MKLFYITNGINGSGARIKKLYLYYNFKHKIFASCICQ